MTMEVMGAELWGHLWELGDELRLGLRKAGVTCVGHGPRTALIGADYTELSQELVARGIMLNRPNYVALPHTQNHVKRTVGAVKQVLDSW